MDVTVSEEAKSETVAQPCLNCGKPVTDRFCGGCGQEVGEPIPKVRDLLFELADEFLKFDSRLLRTAAKLVREPGGLTLEYSRGRKADYIAPFRLYFGCSFVFYLVATLTHWNPSATPIAIEDSAISAGVSKGMEFYYANMATFSIGMIPVCSLVPALLYRKLKLPFLYHLIGTLHTWSGGFLVAVPFMLLSAALRPILSPAIVALFTTVVFMGSNAIIQALAYRRIYRSSWLGSILKTGAMLGFATFLGAIFMSVSIAYFISQEVRTRAESPVSKPALESRPNKSGPQVRQGQL